MNPFTFDMWVHNVCEIIHLKIHKDITEIYSTINLTDAKLAFIDNMSPIEYIDTLY